MGWPLANDQQPASLPANEGLGSCLNPVQPGSQPDHNAAKAGINAIGA
jgi:hypothetical protein